MKQFVPTVQFLLIQVTRPGRNNGMWETTEQAGDMSHLNPFEWFLTLDYVDLIINMMSKRLV